MLDKIRGKKVSEAYGALKIINKKAVVVVTKTLQSAVANADATDDIDKIVVKTSLLLRKAK